MTLNHSKTWPVSTLAVVQLRVDPNGRTYSTVTDQEILLTPPVSQNGAEIKDKHLKHSVTLYENFSLVKCHNKFVEEIQENCLQISSAKDDDEIVLPLSKEHLELFTKMSSPPPIKTTIRTDTISTLLDPTEFESEKTEEKGESIISHEENNNPTNLQKFHVLALTKIEENVDECEYQIHKVGRRPSIKVDNWDFIYTETLPKPPQPSRCPIHRCDGINETNSNGDAAKESLIPDLPLDARKTTTLRRHYYPEGGWGWVIVMCSVLVHVLNHGVQLAYSQLVFPGAYKFKVEKVHFAGECR
ncbi:hypothetical protein NQ315_010642 [Exocentrus adspersus]|uniref:Uncharacterized protein n=1 Tax=Exocentrus adspersus TaxID=1586481 RepID=A0AAV8W5Y6_9CUCU|nr:hypothetical protein NQ315_010642 [Exocentrus adspersus]